MNHRHLLALGALWVLVSGSNAAAVLVVGVHDGDTLTLLMRVKKEGKVRLEGIDAPELGQPHGKASKESSSELVFRKKVSVQMTGKDRYERTLGDVFMAKEWINLAQVERGYAWHYVEYDQDERLRAAEANARKKRVGLWQDRKPVPPWAWRASKK